MKEAASVGGLFHKKNWPSTGMTSWQFNPDAKHRWGKRKLKRDQ
jgi:hypothetical protein